MLIRCQAFSYFKNPHQAVRLKRGKRSIILKYLYWGSLINFVGERTVKRITGKSLRFSNVYVAGGGFGMKIEVERGGDPINFRFSNHQHRQQRFGKSVVE